MFQNHRITGQKSRGNRIHGNQIGVIPRRNNQHNAQRAAADMAVKSGLFRQHNIGQSGFGTLGHMACALAIAIYFTAPKTHGSTHHARQFRHKLGFLCAEMGEHSVDNRFAVSDIGALPMFLGFLRRRQRLFNLSAVGQLAGCKDLPVNRADNINPVLVKLVLVHGVSAPLRSSTK